METKCKFDWMNIPRDVGSDKAIHTLLPLRNISIETRALDVRLLLPDACNTITAIHRASSGIEVSSNAATIIFIRQVTCNS